VHLRRKRKAAAIAPSRTATVASTPRSTCSHVKSHLSQLFDSKRYLEVNGDVAAAGLDALMHFVV
jgi:hypothetical protein